MNHCETTMIVSDLVSILGSRVGLFIMSVLPEFAIVQAYY